MSAAVRHGGKPAAGQVAGHLAAQAGCRVATRGAGHRLARFAMWVCALMPMLTGLGHAQGALGPVVDPRLDQPLVAPGWMSTQAYKQLSNYQRGIYVTGVVEGFGHAPAFGATQQLGDRLGLCLGGLKPQGLLDIVDDFVRGQPAREMMTMNYNVYAAMAQFCRSRALPLDAPAVRP